MTRPTKQIIIIRKELKMRKGKMIAQGGHGVLGSFFNPQNMRVEGDKIILSGLTEAMWSWATGDKQRKIAVGVDTEAELLAIYEQAKAAGIPAVLVEDIGLTEFHGVKTKTVVVLGPEFDDILDPITRHLAPI